MPTLKRQVTLWLELPHYRALRLLAARQGTGMSTLAYRRLRRWLDSLPDPGPGYRGRDYDNQNGERPMQSDAELLEMHDNRENDDVLLALDPEDQLRLVNLLQGRVDAIDRLLIGNPPHEAKATRDAHAAR